MDDVVKTPTDFYAAYIFDMDGTIYLGDHLLPGAKRMIEQLHERNIPVRYLSNNPTKDPAEYAQKLARLGLPTPVEEIVNTVVTTVRWLQANHPDAVVYPISEEPLKRALTEAGFKISEDPSEIDVVIASYDRTLIRKHTDCLRRHLVLQAGHPDCYQPRPFLPLPGRTRSAGCGLDHRRHRGLHRYQMRRQPWQTQPGDAHRLTSGSRCRASQLRNGG